MSCKEIELLISTYIDGELKDEQRLGILEKHLRVCQSCRKELSALSQLKKALSTADRNELTSTPSPFLKGRIMARIAEGRRRSTFLRLRVAYVAATFLILAFVGVGIGLYNSSANRQASLQALYKDLPKEPTPSTGAFTAEGQPLIPASENFLEFARAHHQIAKEMLILRSQWGEEIDLLEKFLGEADTAKAGSPYKELPKHPRNGEKQTGKKNPNSR